METPLRLTCLLVLDADGERICVKYGQNSKPQGAQGASGPLVSGRGAPRDFEGQRRLENLLHQSLTKIRGRTEGQLSLCLFVSPSLSLCVSFFISISFSLCLSLPFSLSLSLSVYVVAYIYLSIYLSIYIYIIIYIFELSLFVV